MHKIGGALSDSSPEDFVDIDQALEKKMDSEPDGIATHREARGLSTVPDDGILDLESALRMDSAQLRELEGENKR